MLGYVPREHLPHLYSASEALVFLSLYEGFGLPLIEAMACGTPIIASNTSCIPEIVGDAGVLVNPYNVEEVASALLNLAEDPELKAELSSKGIQRAGRFKWEHTIRKTIEVYRRCCK
jgi:glycosyltransferase involved in cell wall biosynthesis